MIKHCESCHRPFEASYRWAKVCKPCFIEQKKAETEQLRNEAVYWRDRCLRVESQITHLQSPRAIPPDMLRRLLQLCHPDKHSGSEASQRATAWLLDQRR
jgi:hypothetical protein